MSMRTKMPWRRAASTIRPNCRRHSAGSSFSPSAVSLTEMLESSRSRGDLLERSRVFLDRLLGLLAARHVLAEDVERRHAPFRIELRDRGERLVERLARHVAGREAAHDGLRHERKRADDERG